MKRLHILHKMPRVAFVIIPLIMLVAACGGPPANNPMLTSATEEFKKAEMDPKIVQFAPVALKEAEETLAKSRELWSAKADKSAVDHYAYLASQRTRIAVETARLNSANSEISRGEVERQQVLMDVRRSEADRSESRAQSALREARSEREQAVDARQRAETSRQSAEESRREAMDAQKRAEELAKRVSELEARPTDRGLVVTLGDVLFETGQSTMRSGGNKSMDDLANFLVEYPNRNIMIEGFTDSVGSESMNMELSRRRAASVKDELVKRRINANRISTTGYGLQHPVGDNSTASGRQQNRRVEIIISDEDGKVPARRQ